MGVLSSAVAVSDYGTASAYNNLRTDAITHEHDGTSFPVVAMLNAKYITAQMAAATVKNIIGINASDVLVIGAAGITCTITPATTISGALTLSSTLALGGTVSGGGNQINNVIIGTSTPLAGFFTTITATGLVLTVLSATGGAGFRLPHGAAPTSPVNGDIWTTTVGVYARINSATALLAVSGVPTDTLVVTTQAGNYSVLTTDNVVFCSGTFTITLPTAVGVTGKPYWIKKTDSGTTTTIATTSSQTIDGSTTASITTQYAAITVVSNGSNWLIV